MLAWLSVWSEVHTCIWPSWCHCHSLSLASVKSRLVLPFWYRLTWVIPEKGPINGCVCYDKLAEKKIFIDPNLNSDYFWNATSSKRLDFPKIPQKLIHMPWTITAKQIQTDYADVIKHIPLHTHTQTPILRPFVRDYPGEPVPERRNQSGFYWSKRQWVVVASAGPYASLHLTPDR